MLRRNDMDDKRLLDGLPHAKSSLSASLHASFVYLVLCGVCMC